jgi:hypothetical protein
MVMGRIANITNGAISGKVGPVVYYEMNGKAYVRAAMMPRAKESWSTQQNGVRQKVSRLAALWRQLSKNPLRQIWEQAAVGMSAYNLFLKTNLPAFKGTAVQADLEFLHLSTGQLPLPHHLNAQMLDGNTSLWQVSWNDDSGYMIAQLGDELMAIFAHDGKFTNPEPTGLSRTDQSGQVQVPEKVTNLQGMYLFFVSADKNTYSPDQFFGV